MPFLQSLGAALGVHTRATIGYDVDGQPYINDGYAPGAGVIPPSRLGGNVVSLDSAASLPAVYRALALLSSTVSQLGLEVRRGDEILPLPSLIRQPDVDKTLSQVLKRTTTALAGTGNAYWRLIRNDAGTVVSINDLDPLSITIEYDKGKKFFRSGEKRYKATDIKHLRMLEMPGHDEGVGPIQACRAAMQSALDLRTYGDSWTNTSGVPTGVLSTNLQLTAADRTAYQEAWAKTQAVRQTAVLAQGLTYSPIMIKPADAMFIESQQYSTTDVARMFGIPAPLLLAAVEGNSMTYSNMETIDRQFVSYAVMPYLKEIEDALSSLLPRGQVAKFILSGLLRPDAKASADIHKIYLDAGVLSPGEVRKEMGVTGPAPAPKPLPVAAPVAPAPDEEAEPNDA
jgi:HK97 family phage portal protein